MIEIDLTKLLQTSGLVRKKVLVRKKGGKAFWSTRWIREGDDIKEVVTSLGFEVVEDKPEEKRVPTDMVHLQGVGDVPSIPASDVRIGDDRMFNYGGTEKIIAIDQKSPKTLLFTYDHIDSTTGKNYTQSVRMSAKVAIKELYDDEVKAQREARKKRQSEKPEPKPEIVIPEPVVEVKPEVQISDRSIDDIKKDILRLEDQIQNAVKEGKFEIVDNLYNELKGLKKELKKTEELIFQETLVPLSGDFVPSTTVGEAITRIGNQFIRPPSDEAIERNLTFHFDYGIDFGGLKLKSVNSIINGFEKTIGKYGIKLDYTGWNKRKQNVVAKYSRDFGDLHHAIQFQKTATKNVKRTKKETIEAFGINKDKEIEKLERYLTYKEMRSGDRDRDRNKIARFKACSRWTVDCSSEDPLAVTAAHEGMHVIYHKFKLKEKWMDNLTYLVGHKMCDEIKCASVSEYGMSNNSELFAEVGAAVAFGIEIDPDVKQAYLDTIRGINR